MLRNFLNAGLVSFMLITPAAQASEVTVPEGYSAYRTKASVKWLPKTNTITVIYHTGCRSAHYTPKLNENFDISFDENKRELNIAGSYISKDVPRKARRIRPADCMGSRQKRFEIHDVEHGPYNLFRDGELVMSVVLSDQEGEYKFDGYNSANGPGKLKK